MKLLPLALLAVGGGVLYSLYSTKPRFLGDKARVGDEATVPLSLIAGSVPPEVRATIGATDLGIVKITRATPDTIEGPVVAMQLPDGRRVPAPAFPAAFTFPRSSIAALSREGKTVPV